MYFPSRDDVVEIDVRVPSVLLRAPVIVQAVADAFNISTNDIISQRRHQSIMGARFAAYWLARELTSYSLPKIGEIMGRRDHTTIMHGITKCERRQKDDPIYRNRVADARQKIVEKAN